MTDPTFKPSPEPLQRVEGYAFIVREPKRGREFLLTASFGRSKTEATRHMKTFNTMRASQHQPFFVPVRMVDTVLTVDDNYQAASP